MSKEPVTTDLDLIEGVISRAQQTSEGQNYDLATQALNAVDRIRESFEVKLLPCPFCGCKDIDPEGVASFKPEYRTSDNNWKTCTPDMLENRPACANCNTTTDGDWNARI